MPVWPLCSSGLLKLIGETFRPIRGVVRRAQGRPRPRRVAPVRRRSRSRPATGPRCSAFRPAPTRAKRRDSGPSPGILRIPANSSPAALDVCRDSWLLCVRWHNFPQNERDDHANHANRFRGPAGLLRHGGPPARRRRERLDRGHRSHAGDARRPYAPGLGRLRRRHLLDGRMPAKPPRRPPRQRGALRRVLPRTAEAGRLLTNPVSQLPGAER